MSVCHGSKSFCVLWPGGGNIPVHVDEAAKRHAKGAHRLGDAAVPRAVERDGQRGSRRRRAPGGDPRTRVLEPVHVRVHAREGEEDDGHGDVQVDGHAGEGAGDEDAEVPAHRDRVELEDVGQDEGEDAKGGALDDEGDDNGDHALDLAGGAQDGG